MVFVVPPAVDSLVPVNPTDVPAAAANGNEGNGWWRRLFRLWLRANKPLTERRRRLPVLVVTPTNDYACVLANSAYVVWTNTDRGEFLTYRVRMGAEAPTIWRAILPQAAALVA